MSGVSFKAHSLADLAAYFDNLAADADKRAAHAAPRKADEAKAEARTWRNAAEVVRRTVLEAA